LPKFWLFCHNFRTRNVRKLIKGSKDSGFSQVSNTILSQMIPSSDWHPAPGNLGQNGLKPTPLMTSPTKNPKSKTFKLKKCKPEDLPHLLRVWTAF